MLHPLKGANLKKIDCQIDSLGLCRFIETLVKSDSVENKSYHSVFMTHDIMDAPMLIGAAGRLLGIRVSVSNTEVLGEIDMHGEVIHTLHDTTLSPYRSMPFPRIYDIANKLLAVCKDLIPDEFANVPLMGGQRCALVASGLQTVLDFYLPEYCLFGGDDNWNLFLSENLSGMPLGFPTAAGNVAYPTPHIQNIKEIPDHEGYIYNLSRVLETLRSGALKKIVFSRKCIVTAEEHFDPISYAAYLMETLYQEYFYLFRHGEDCHWAGVTPGIIFRTGNGLGRTKILAGTSKKTSDPETNKQNMLKLASDEKEITEHDAALYHMYNTLQAANLGKTEITKNKVILETPYSYHLRSDITVYLNERITPFDILHEIFPPATVWGIPVDITEQVLRETEPFDREFYSGTYGFITLSGRADFAQFIRSVRLDTDQVTIFGGGGILPESDPASEWSETVGKMAPFLGFFKTGE